MSLLLYLQQLQLGGIRSTYSKVVVNFLRDDLSWRTESTSIKLGQLVVQNKHSRVLVVPLGVPFTMDDQSDLLRWDDTPT